MEVMAGRKLVRAPSGVAGSGEERRISARNVSAVFVCTCATNLGSVPMIQGGLLQVLADALMHVPEDRERMMAEDTASCQDTATRGRPKKRRAGQRARCWPNQMREVPAGAQVRGLVVRWDWCSPRAFGREPGTEWTAEASSARARLIPGGPVRASLRSSPACAARSEWIDNSESGSTVRLSGHRPYLVSFCTNKCPQPMCAATLRLWPSSPAR